MIFMLCGFVAEITMANSHSQAKVCLCVMNRFILFFGLQCSAKFLMNFFDVFILRFSANTKDADLCTFLFFKCNLAVLLSGHLVMTIM